MQACLPVKNISATKCKPPVCPSPVVVLLNGQHSAFDLYSGREHFYVDYIVGLL